MSSVLEDIRKIMNVAPFADPFSEAFDPSTDSLEAIRGAIDALESGTFGYGLIAGPEIVEIGDKGEWATELLNPGGAIIPAGSITPGTYTIYQVRAGAAPVQKHTHAAVAADGRVELDVAYEFTDAVWNPGDLYQVVFDSIYTTIGGTVTYYPDLMITGRVTRDYEIEEILEYTPVATLKDAIEDNGASIYNRLGNPTGRTHFPSLYTMLELDDDANYNLDDILRTGFTTAGADLGTGSIMERIGTIGNTSHNRSVLEGMGLPDDDLTTLYELMVTGYATAGSHKGDGAILERIGTVGNAAHNRSVLEGMGLPNLDLTTLYELMVTGYVTAGADKGTGSIMERIGTIGNAAHNRSVLEGMGLPNTDLTTLYELLVDGYVTEGDADRAGAIIEKLNYIFDIVEDDTDSVLNRIGAFDGSTVDAQSDIFRAIDPPADGHGIMTITGKDDEDATLALWDTNHWEGTILARQQKILDILTKGTGSSIGANLSIIDLFGAFDGGGTPQGDIFQALGVGATYSIWDAVQYISHTAIPASPTAGSIAAVLVEGITERTNDDTLEELLGIPDDVNGSLGDRLGFAHATHPFTTTENLRAILGTGLTSTQHLYGVLGGYTLADTLKEATDVLLQQDLTTQTRDLRSIAGYVEGIGVSVASDGYDSTPVTANEDGSVFERLEHIKKYLVDGDVTSTTYATVNNLLEQTIATFTAKRTGRIAIELDVSNIPTAGNIVTVRLKHAIDGTTPKIIDRATFVVGTDEVHPTVSGWVDKAITNGVQITIQCSIVPGTVSVPYRIIESA